MAETMLGRDAAFYEAHSATNTVREILQQPEVWRQLARDMGERRAAVAAFMEEVTAVPGLRVVFTGAGSSAFIGESMQPLLARELGLRSESVATTDIVSAPDCFLYPDAPTLLVSFARSGESPESLAAVKYAAKTVKRLYNLVVVCNAGSSLAKLAEATSNTLVLNMPPKSCDVGFAMTSSVSCMALGTWCAFGWKELDARMAFIDKLADYAEGQYDTISAVTKAAAAFDYKRLVYLGSGGLKGLAREGAVKSLELTDGGVNATFETPMGFRHGPKTVVKADTLTAHLVSPVPFTTRYDMDVVDEIVREKHGNKLLVVAPEGGPAVNGADWLYTYKVVDSAHAEMGAYALGLIVVQLLSLEKSLLVGIPTDSPSVGGQANRVVKGVTLYDL